ncbi:unnamed protein product [Hapterophycus canaliculatus]
MWAPTTVQETWLGASGCSAGDGGSADEGFLGSLEAGGALMSAGGGWSLSTLPGEEGLRWNGAVKTEQEVFDEWAGVYGVVPLQQAILHPSPLLGTATTPTAGVAGDNTNAKVASLAKSDAEEGWKSFVDPSPTILPSSKNAKKLHSKPEIASTANTAEGAPAAPGTRAFKLPGAWPTATHSAGSSTRDNIAALKRQRSSPAAGPAITPKTATATPAPPSTRVATKSATKTAAAAPPPRAPPAGAKTRTRRSAGAAPPVGPVKAELAEEEDEEGEEEDDDDDEEYAAGSSRRKSAPSKKTAKARAGDSEDEFDLDDDPVGSELTDKRRRNREHAKRSRLRKRVRLGGLEEMVLGLRRENVRLRQMVMRGIPDRAGAIIRACAKDNTNADVVAKQDVVQGMRPGMSVGSSSSSWSARGGTRSRPKIEGGSSRRGSGGGGRGGGSGGGTGGKDRRVPSAMKLMSPCYQTVKALADSQTNFILTNPNLPDCPIIFASQGFLELTGYEGKDVIGKNCRFLQGPGTDPITLSIVRNNIEAGRDSSVCILNYKKDGTPFWNQLSIGVLLDAHGQVANHVAVMYEINPMAPAVFHRLLHRVPLPESLLNDESESESDGEGKSNHRRDPVERSEVAAGSFNHSAASGGSSRSSSACGDAGGGTGAGAAAPRVVDRLRRTRAAAAAISNGGGSNM